MSNIYSKYKDQILEFRKEGKTYKEISKLLKCSMSTVGYHINDNQSTKQKQNNIINKDYTKSKRKKGVERNREFIEDYLKDKKCVDCGNRDRRVFEFDHVKGVKSKSISYMIKSASKIEKLKEEIEKCEIRCCNCHRIITIERRKHKL